jgi:hypothetical protein
MCTGDAYQCVKGLHRQPHQSPSFSAEFKNVWSCNAVPPFLHLQRQIYLYLYLALICQLMEKKCNFIRAREISPLYLLRFWTLLSSQNIMKLWVFQETWKSDVQEKVVGIWMTRLLKFARYWTWTRVTKFVGIPLNQAFLRHFCLCNSARNKFRQHHHFVLVIQQPFKSR